VLPALCVVDARVLALLGLYEEAMRELYLMAVCDVMKGLCAVCCVFIGKGTSSERGLHQQHVSFRYVS
jgi:hypothetical protein